MCFQRGGRQLRAALQVRHGLSRAATHRRASGRSPGPRGSVALRFRGRRRRRPARRGQSAAARNGRCRPKSAPGSAALHPACARIAPGGRPRRALVLSPEASPAALASEIVVLPVAPRARIASPAAHLQLPRQAAAPRLAVSNRREALACWWTGSDGGRACCACQV
eukprot:scaffold13307_cov97-Isochrysis_galbana.AAC.5